MNLMFAGYIEYLLVSFYEIASREKSLTSKKDKQRFIAKKDYFVEQTIETMAVPFFHVIPSRDEVLAFSRLVFNQLLNNPQKKPRERPSFSIMTLFAMPDIRKHIEILSILNLGPELIYESLGQINFTSKEDCPEVIDLYLQYFWNYSALTETERNLFFSRAIELDFYSLQSKIYYEKVSVDIVLPLIGIDHEKLNLDKQLKRYNLYACHQN